MKKVNKGFTLIEILVVIGIIAILAAIVIVAINPTRQFAQARDAQRTSDISAISNAIGQFMADNRGDLPGGIPTGDSTVDANYDEIASGAGNADICGDLVPDYMAAFPVDPDSGDEPVTDCSAAGGYSTDYFVIQDSTSDRVTIQARNAEIADDIEITR